jgi:hypothetical protein
MDIRCALPHNQETPPPMPDAPAALSFWFYGYYQTPGIAWRDVTR